jgi:hypothetical protein
VGGELGPVDRELVSVYALHSDIEDVGSIANVIKASSNAPQSKSSIPILSQIVEEMAQKS